MAGTSTVRFKDLGIEKFRGPEQDFTAWLHEFDDGVDLGNYTWQSKVALLKSTLDGNCKLQAAAYVKKYKEDKPQRPSESEEQYYEKVYVALCKSLKQDPIVVGLAPERRLLDQWRTLKQKDQETVRQYHQRIDTLHRSLLEQDLLFKRCDKEVCLVFVSGLKKPIKDHVETQNLQEQTIACALKSAEKFEKVHKDSLHTWAESYTHEGDAPSTADRTSRGMEDMRGSGYDHQSSDSDPEICAHFLAYGHCQNGDGCYRLHLRFPDKRDIRDEATIATDEAAQKVTQHLEQQVSSLQMKAAWANKKAACADIKHAFWAKNEHNDRYRRLDRSNDDTGSDEEVDQDRRKRSRSRSRSRSDEDSRTDSDEEAAAHEQELKKTNDGDAS